MMNANSHLGTLRYPLIMYTILFTYVAHYLNKKIGLVLSFLCVFCCVVITKKSNNNRSSNATPDLKNIAKNPVIVLTGAKFFYLEREIFFIALFFKIVPHSGFPNFFMMQCQLSASLLLQLNPTK